MNSRLMTIRIKVKLNQIQSDVYAMHFAPCHSNTFIGFSVPFLFAAAFFLLAVVLYQQPRNFLTANYVMTRHCLHVALRQAFYGVLSRFFLAAERGNFPWILLFIATTMLMWIISYNLWHECVCGCVYVWGERVFMGLWTSSFGVYAQFYGVHAISFGATV